MNKDFEIKAGQVWTANGEQLSILYFFTVADDPVPYCQIERGGEFEAIATAALLDQLEGWTLEN